MTRQEKDGLFLILVAIFLLLASNFIMLYEKLYQMQENGYNVYLGIAAIFCFLIGAGLFIKQPRARDDLD